MPAKVCLRCNQDCSAKPRIRDQHGRYVCRDCLKPGELAAVAQESTARAITQADDVYAIEPDTHDQPPITSVCPACSKALPPGAVLCVSCGYDTRKGFQIGTGVGATDAKGGATKCPHCGYSLQGLKARKCPECGKIPYKSKKDELLEESKRTSRNAYLIPIASMAVGLPVMMLLAWLFHGGPAVVGILILWAVCVPVGFIAYMIVCAVWAGFDAPIHLSLLRLGAVFAVGAVAHMMLSPISVGWIGVAIQLIVFAAIITALMDLEFHESVLMAIILGALFVIATVIMAMYL